jgi:hypothetical protein
MRLGLFSAIATCVAADSPFWASLKDTLTSQAVQDHDSVTVEELLSGAALTATSCGTTGDVMDVKSVEFDLAARAAVVRGELSQALSGGKVFAEIERAETPEDEGIAERMKKGVLWAAAGAKRVEEALCEHLDRTSKNVYDACPMPAGDQELRFAFNRLPKIVMAGHYHLKLQSLDNDGNQITCVKGSLTVARGKDGQLLRHLQEAASSAQTKGLGLAAVLCIMASYLF